jgi:tetratricopeptide (TPR) repeat protein
MEWEQSAGEDPSIFLTLGQRYTSKNLHDDAVRCFETSIELSPAYNAHILLADSYRASGQPELWKPTLERFLEVPSLGLEHGWIHQRIANDHISREEWEAAEPHALAAAQTWSAWGLGLASTVCEALSQWEESEKWIREKATNYPSSSAYDWYSWCRRTGRGDVAEARKLAESVMTPAWLAGHQLKAMFPFIDCLLEDKPLQAIAHGKQLVEDEASTDANNRVYVRMQLTLVAAEVKDDELLRSTIAEIRDILANESEALEALDPSLVEVVSTICNLAEAKSDENADALPEASIVDLRSRLETFPINERRNYFYLAGRALELRGNVEAADAYYRTIIDEAPFDKICRNLAGHRLAKRHGTSRP